jgi:putative oxidoreductase
VAARRRLIGGLAAGYLGSVGPRWLDDDKESTHERHTRRNVMNALVSAVLEPASDARPASRAWHRLVDTHHHAAPLVARLALALLILPHGAQHALGWFGGYGFSGTLGWMTGALGLPAPLAALAIVTELLAPLALVVGAGSRLAALGVAGIMLGAISTHLPNGFFMNWFGALPSGSEGFEYHLVVLALCAVVVLQGGGAFSVDRRIARSLG